MFFFILNLNSKDGNLVLECLILSREGFDHRLDCGHLLLKIEKFPKDKQRLPQSLCIKNLSWQEQNKKEKAIYIIKMYLHKLLNMR